MLLSDKGLNLCDLAILQFSESYAMPPLFWKNKGRKVRVGDPRHGGIFQIKAPWDRINVKIKGRLHWKSVHEIAKGKAAETDIHHLSDLCRAYAVFNEHFFFNPEPLVPSFFDHIHPAVERTAFRIQSSDFHLSYTRLNFRLNATGGIEKQESFPMVLIKNIEIKNGWISNLQASPVKCRHSGEACAGLDPVAGIHNIFRIICLMDAGFVVPGSIRDGHGEKILGAVDKENFRSETP